MRRILTPSFLLEILYFQVLHTSLYSELIFTYGIRLLFRFILLHGAVQFLHIIYWRDYSSPIVYSWLHHHKLICHTCMGLFLCSLYPLFYVSIFIQNHTVLITKLCNTVWNQRTWRSSFVLSQDHVVYSVLFWSVHILLLFYFCEKWKCHWNFDRDCILSVDCFRKDGNYNNIIPIHGTSFPYFYFYGEL